MGKSAGLFAWTRQTEDSTFRELKPLSKAFQMLFFQKARLGKSMQRRRGKEGEEEDEGSFDMAVSASLPRDSTFDDNPVSNSLYWTSSSIYSTVAIIK